MKTTIFVSVQRTEMSKYIYILPALITLFWVIRIFFKKDAVRTQLFVSVGMLMAAISLFYLNDTVSLVFPFLYLAVKNKTSASGTGRFDWIPLLPSVLFLPFNQTMAFYIYSGVQIVAISVWYIVRINRYNRLTAEYYVDCDSSSENLGEILAYVIATVMVISVFMILPDVVAKSIWIQLGLVSFLCVLQYLIGMKTFNISSDFDISTDAQSSGEEPEQVMQPQATADSASDNSEERTTGVSKLLQKVIDDKMYLDPMLSLVSLAATLNTNRTYLSNDIHSCYNQNFSDFINSLRIEYALTLMKNGDGDASIKEIALQSGYNNVQSFYRHFAEIMEMTPKTWMSRNLK